MAFPFVIGQRQRRRDQAADKSPVDPALYFFPARHTLSSSHSPNASVNTKPNVNSQPS
jgi:hypothetical protein